MFEQYGITKEELADPILSPIFNKKGTYLPDATFLIAEYQRCSQ
jgi:hypothetical protein